MKILDTASALMYLLQEQWTSGIVEAVVVKFFYSIIYYFYCALCF